MSELTMPFGKYQGQKVSTLPSPYIEWILENHPKLKIHNPKLRKHLLIQFAKNVWSKNGNQKVYSSQ